MEARVEGRVGQDEVPQLGQRALLVPDELGAGPALASSQAATVHQDAAELEEAHGVAVAVRHHRSEAMDSRPSAEIPCPRGKTALPGMTT